MIIERAGIAWRDRGRPFDVTHVEGLVGNGSLILCDREVERVERLMIAHKCGSSFGFMMSVVTVCVC